MLWWIRDQQVNVVFLPIELQEFSLVVITNGIEDLMQVLQMVAAEYLPAPLADEHQVDGQ